MIEKERAIKVINSLIGHPCSFLDTKYYESHHKFAIKYKEHVIEIIGDDHKFIKYYDEKIPINTSEYKSIYNLVAQELEKRKQRTLQRFNDLEKSLDPNIYEESR